MAEWSVEVVFPMDDNWLDQDRMAKHIAAAHDADFLGSGAGCGERDIQWTLSNKKKASDLIKHLKRVGFKTILRKLDPM